MTRTRRRNDDLPVGRWAAPPLVEHDRHGRPLTVPYPERRHTVTWLLRGAGALAAAGTIAVTNTAALVAVLLLLALVVVAPALLARRLVPLPDPTFATVGYAQPHTLTAHQWIRLPNGWAVQTYDVRVVIPDTLGDPTPPTVQLRCSDDITRTFRPHDLTTSSHPSTSPDPQTARPGRGDPPARIAACARQMPRLSRSRQGQSSAVRSDTLRPDP